MASKAPPIPPEQRSSPSDKPHVREDGDIARQERTNLKEQGRQGNIHQNTHNQGYQQDR
jgi:hypothetical protein